MGNPLHIRWPVASDARQVWAVVRDGGVLDLNSPYAYLLLCTDFADTSLVAEDRGRVVGFVAAYRPPPRPDVIFVWQVAVADAAQRRGLGHALLDELVTRLTPRGVRFLEATVTPSNRPSWALFRGLATKHGVRCQEEVRFPVDLFPTAEHEEEVRVRLGPFAHHDEKRRGEGVDGCI